MLIPSVTQADTVSSAAPMERPEGIRRISRSLAQTLLKGSMSVISAKAEVSSPDQRHHVECRDAKLKTGTDEEGNPGFVTPHRSQ